MVARGTKYPSKTYKDDNGKSMGFIRYQETGGKKKHLSGAFCHSYWDDNRPKVETTWLGKVIDIEENIFMTQKDGIYQFTPPNIIKHLASGPEEYYRIVATKSKNTDDDYEKPRLSTIFGSVFVLGTELINSGLAKIFRDSFGSFGDAIFALVLFKLTSNEAHMHVKCWWEETYTKYIYPNLNLESQRISEILEEIGKEKYWRVFFEQYIDYLKKMSPTTCVLIDSTGMPNAIDIDLTQVSNHGGKITRTIRLIVLLDKITGYPVYFKYIPGNIVDKVTLQVVFNEMEGHDISVNSVIMDAGYCSEEIFKFLYDSKVNFITRFIPNLTVYKDLIKNKSKDINNLKYHIRHSDRNIMIKKVPFKFKGMNLYAYICKDIIEANKQVKNLLDRYDMEDEKEIIETAEKLKKSGLFILVSSTNLLTNDILTHYYERQAIEQLFDYAKNDLDLVPLRKHSEETFRGHIMVCFMATIAHTYLTKLLAKSKDCKIPLREAISSLNRHVSSVFEKKNILVPDIPTPLMRKIYHSFKIDIPAKLFIDKCAINIK
jgi:hypothetical protein